VPAGIRWWPMRCGPRADQALLHCELGKHCCAARYPGVPRLGGSRDRPVLRVSDCCWHVEHGRQDERGFGLPAGRQLEQKGLYATKRGERLRRLVVW
jgi:hypothetical protein